MIIQRLPENTQNWSGEAIALLGRAFGNSASETSFFETTLSGDVDNPNVYFGAYEGSQLVGFNAFIATPLRRGHERKVAYQSCWSATHPDHLGKGIFPKLMMGAAEELAAKAEYIFGLPNPASFPIFVKKLGYRAIPTCSWRSFTLLPMLKRRLTASAPTVGYIVDERAIAEAKSAVLPIIEYSTESAFLWGKVVRARWKGLPLRVFKTGGLTLGDGAHLPELFNQSRRAGASGVQVVMPETHELGSSFIGLKPLDGLQPFIMLDLLGESNAPLNVMYGAIDVF